MGQEIPCAVNFEGKRWQGKALLETSELLFRGEIRLKIPFSSIQKITATDGVLSLKTAEGVAAFEIGAKAGVWRDKILNPKSLIDKLGVKPGDAVNLEGSFDKEFRESLKKHGAKISKAGDPPWILLDAEKREDLVKVKAIAGMMQGAAALWIVYPKKHKAIAESDVRTAGLKAGLVDVKIASFSETHTALKFVIPKGKR